MERRRSTRDRSRGPKAKPPPEQLPGSRKKKPAAKKSPKAKPPPEQLPGSRKKKPAAKKSVPEPTEELNVPL